MIHKNNNDLFCVNKKYFLKFFNIILFIFKLHETNAQITTHITFT